MLEILAQAVINGLLIGGGTGSPVNPIAIL